MNPDLPAALRLACEALLEGVSRAGLSDRATKISKAYRSGRESLGVIAEHEDATAYMLSRMPATFAACARAFDEVGRQIGTFTPASVLDAGAGPGGASWAAITAWPQIETLCLIDSNPFLLALSDKLAKYGPPPVRQATRLSADLTSEGPWPSADLVVSSYALVEIPEAKRADYLLRLWAACRGILVLVEPGTPEGWQRVLAARDQLLGLDGRVLAPCPHEQACPISKAGDWCHFTQRLSRSRDHRLAKGAKVPFEDEKFAYLAMARPDIGPVRGRQARILAPPFQSKPGIEFKVCTPAGDLKLQAVSKRDKVGFARARRLGWGDQTN